MVCIDHSHLFPWIILIFDYSRLAHKLGFVSEEDDQVDKDP